MHSFFDCIFNKFNIFRINAGMCDKNQRWINIRISSKFVFYIFHKNFIKRSTIFLSYIHTAICCADFDTRL